MTKNPQDDEAFFGPDSLFRRKLHKLRAETDELKNKTAEHEAERLHQRHSTNATATRLDGLIDTLREAARP